MGVTRVYITNDIENQDRITLDQAASRHLVQVMRLREGDKCVAFNGDGFDYQATITRSHKNHCEISIDHRSDREAPAVLQFHLAAGISRGERMDYMIQKAVELGVHSITPLFTERTNVQLKGERLTKRLNHWHGVMISACEQSGRRLIPSLLPSSTLADWLKKPHSNGILLDHRAANTLATLTPPESSVTLLVGPEGGLSEIERIMAQEQRFNGARLGPRVMRTETAPLAALASMQTLWGDFN